MGGFGPVGLFDLDEEEAKEICDSVKARRSELGQYAKYVTNLLDQLDHRITDFIWRLEQQRLVGAGRRCVQCDHGTILLTDYDLCADVTGCGARTRRRMLKILKERQDR